MNPHDTHNLSISSSEEHTYKIDNVSSSKGFPQEDVYISKNEEKNDWSKIIIKNNKELQNTITLEKELQYIVDTNNDQDSSEKSKNKDKVIKTTKKQEKHNLRLQTFSPNNNSKKKGNEEKIVRTEKKMKTEGKKESDKKAEIKGKVQEVLKVMEEKKQRLSNAEKFRLLENGIVMKKINRLQEDSITPKNCRNNKYELNNNTIKEKMFEESENICNLEPNNNNINNYSNKDDNNDEDKNILQIKKPDKFFITKCFFIRRNKHKSVPNVDILTTLNNLNNMSENIYKNDSNKKNKNKNIYNYYNNENKKNEERKIKHSNSSVNAFLGRQKKKSNTAMVLKNKDNNIDKFEEKMEYLRSPKQYRISNSQLCFTRGAFRKRPLSSNIIKKEVDFNLKSLKPNSSFYNKSFCIQRIYQISSINNNTKKRVIFGNKHFLNQLKELKNAFELSDCNIDININKHIIYNNSCKNTNSFKRKMRMNNTGYNSLFPSPLFSEFSSIYNDNITDDFEKYESGNMMSCKCDYKKHFGNEQKCPICISKKADNKKLESKLSNRSYYFPFKNNYNNNNPVQTKYNMNNKKKCKIKYDNYELEDLIDFVKMKNENKKQEDNYYNPFIMNKINSELIKRNKTTLRLNSGRQIKRDKNRIKKKYKALQAYLE